MYSLKILVVLLMRIISLTNSKCSDPNIAKFEGAAYFEDFLDRSNSSLVTDVLRRSVSTYQKALDYMNSTTRDSFHTPDGQLSALSPSSSGCAWLQVQYIDRSGLGHSLACFGKYILDAVANNLTFYTAFVSSAHDICDLMEYASFFGIHEVFYWARGPAENATKIAVGTPDGGGYGCTSETIKSAVEGYKKANGEFSCDKGDVVFLCHNRFEDFAQRHVHTLGGYEKAVRAAFRAGYERQYRKYLLPKLSYDLDHGIVAVLHLRRGDVLESRVIDKAHRLTSFSVLVSTIKNILAAKRSYELANNVSFTPLPISFFILAEGSKDSETVLEYDENNPHSLHPLNVTVILGDACNEKSMCKVEVLWQASFYESFTVMCEADILVTSTSGFAWVAGAVCVPPMTVGIEGWNDFKAFANVVPIKSQGPLWSHSTTVRLEGIDEGWISMLESRRRRRSGLRAVISTQGVNNRSSAIMLRQ